MLAFHTLYHTVIGIIICKQSLVYGQSRRAAGQSDDEKEEDLEMSKELVNVLIKEVYNKLLKNVGPEGVKNVRVFNSLTVVFVDV